MGVLSGNIPAGALKTGDSTAQSLDSLVCSASADRQVELVGRHGWMRFRVRKWLGASPAVYNGGDLRVSVGAL